MLVISGEAGVKTKQFCRDFGAVAYFEEPVNFYALRVQLANSLKTRRKERRSEVALGWFRLRYQLIIVGENVCAHR